MNPTDPSLCPECGKPVPADSQHQVCPACLMAQALASRTILPDGETNDSIPPLSPQEIAGKFPQFEITECLGRGGMGVVYKARQKSLGRWVAIKILPPERVGEERFAERFAREAATLAKLSHPNIVTIHDFGEADGLFYIVMEFIDGVNLRDLLRDGKLEPKQALAIVPPVCEALQYAHDKGVVHRDIKPENLLLDRDGRIKIADFGIAALIGAGGENTGTPPYMAPEQSGDSQEVDSRADIYALGVVFYEMLTGERPQNDFIAPSRKVQVDVRIDEMVLRALEKNPEMRYQTAGEFRTAVETMAGAPSQPAGRAAEVLLRTGESHYATAEFLATPWGAMKLHEGVGTLSLHSDRLVLNRGWQSTEIPFRSVRRLSVASYPFWLSPAGLHSILVEFEEAGQIRRVMLTPGKGMFGFARETRQRVAEWFSAIREAITTARGGPPAGSEIPELYRGFSSDGILLVKLFLPVALLVLIGFFMLMGPKLLSGHPIMLIFVLGMAIPLLIAQSRRKRWRHDNLLPQTGSDPLKARSRNPEERPDQTPPKESIASPSRCSVAAIGGACWAGLFLVAVVPWLIDWEISRHLKTHQPLFFAWLSALPLLLGLTALPGTTILGWLAVAQIRRSEGKLYGMRLAVFDGLLFPLLAMNGLVAGGAVAGLRLGLHLRAGTAPPFWLLLFLALGGFWILVALIFANGFIIRRVLRAVRKPSGGSDPGAGGLSAGSTHKRPAGKMMAVGCALLATGFLWVTVPWNVFSKRIEDTRRQARNELQVELGDKLADLLGHNRQRIAYSNLTFDFAPDAPRIVVQFGGLQGWSGGTQDGAPHPLNGEFVLNFLEPDLWQVSGTGDLAEIHTTLQTATHDFSWWPESRLTPPTPGEESVLSASFAPVVELTLPINEKGFTDLLDPDTATIFASAGSADGSTQRPTDMSKAGLVISRDERKNEIELVGMNGVMTQESRADQWDEITNRQALDTLRKNYMSYGGMQGAVVPDNLPQTFLFKSAAGKIGILQITAFTENPRGVKIRYKLVRTADDPKPITPAILEELSRLRAEGAKDLESRTQSPPEDESDLQRRIEEKADRAEDLLRGTAAEMMVLEEHRLVHEITAARKADDGALRKQLEAQADVINARLDQLLPLETASAPDAFLPVVEQEQPFAESFDPETGRSWPSPFRPPGGSANQIAPGLQFIAVAGQDQLGFSGVSGFVPMLSSADQWEHLTDFQAFDTLRMSIKEDNVRITALAPAKPPQTFLFQTATGRVGMLQVTGTISDPPGLKIRYKLAKNAAAKNQQ